MMEGYKKSVSSLEENGMSEAKRRFPFFKKHQEDVEVFYIALPPLLGEGYDPNPASFHIEGAILDIPDTTDENGERQVWRVRHKCLGKMCPKCKDLAKKHGSMSKAPFIQKRQTEHNFVAALLEMVGDEFVFASEDGSFKNSLHTISYRYRWSPKAKSLVCADWDNLIDRFEELDAKGVNPTNPQKAVVFEVRKEVVSSNGFDITYYRHTPLEGVYVAMPSDWEDAIRSFRPLDELFISLSASEMQTLMRVEEEMSQIKFREENNPSLEEMLKDKFHELKSIKSERFMSALDTILNKNQEEAINEPSVSQPGGYSRQSQKDLNDVTEAPPWQSSDSQSKIDRVAAIKARILQKTAASEE